MRFDCIPGECLAVCNGLQGLFPDLSRNLKLLLLGRLGTAIVEGSSDYEILAGFGHSYGIEVANQREMPK